METLVVDTAVPDWRPDDVIASPGPETPTQADQPDQEFVSAPVSPITPPGDDNEEVEEGLDDLERHSSVRDSMASIALSASSLDYDHLSADQVHDVLATPKVRGVSRHLRKPSSLEILQNTWPARPELERQSTLFDTMKDEPLETPISAYEQDEWEEQAQEREYFGSSIASPPFVKPRVSSLLPPRRTSTPSSDEQEVDWQQLDKNEEQEKEDKDLPAGAEDESTAFLLARLEQENAKIDAFSKAAVTKSVERLRSDSRPPSMGHLKRLVQDRNAPSVRYSLAPDTQLPTELPPMTELEFWAALVQDYPTTASRLPTLTTTKIRSGIPPPLRGVVWTSMSGARDKALEEAFETLQHESSPYEGIINKDVGRSFPGVELFRDAEGEGQKMLGRVLKCFSLHDKDIGYCQGLGFLVGPLLMNMGEREAFCVLVRLMDHYALRPSFLPSLSGLHMRIYQFSALLRQHQPALSEHLANLGVEPAYLSQWFLSCFAVTCPLPMLFRIYDVIFAEGANETVMRVALALVRRNEATMLAATEFEEVMQLLLGRAIWDCYGCNADELVDDFTSLGGIITHARLAELEKEFEKQSSEGVGQSAGFLPDVQAAASRFLGRLWAPSHAHTPSKSTTTLSPHSAEKDVRTGSFLRRSPSKQSISTLNESTGSEGSTGSGAASLASTAPTEPDGSDVARESQADTMSFKSKPESMRTVSISTGHGIPATPGLSKEEKDMHGQIEDLLTALSEMQREHQQLAAMLQREREERSDDHRAVRQLIGHLRKDEGDDQESVTSRDDRRRTLPPPPRQPEETEQKRRPRSVLIEAKGGQQKEELESLLEKVSERLETNKRFSASFETKAQLRSTLARTREQLVAAEAQSRDLSARLEVAESSVAAFTSESEDLRAEVKELRVRVNEEFKARQKLEHTVSDLRAGARSLERKDRERLARAESTGEVPTLSRKESSPDAQKARTASLSGRPMSMVSGSGLRELKLARRDSTSSVQSLSSRRTQRLSQTPAIRVETNFQPAVAPSPDAATSASPPPSAVLETPVSAITPASALPVPPAATFAPRGSSLATREVFATPQHEAVPEEALLLELVNAKTAEAQARQEIDELKRSLAISTRRHDAALQQLQSEIEAANAAAEAARIDAAHQVRKAFEAADAAKADVVASLLATPSLSVSVPTTPAAYDEDNRSIGGTSDMATPAEEAVRPRKAETAPSQGSGGWFWSRRTPSTSKAVVTPPPAE